MTTYVIVDELYHRFAPLEVKRRRHVLDVKLSASEIITIALCGESIGIDSENAWFSFVKKNYRHLFPQLCSRTRFNRTRRALMQTTELLRQKMLSAFPVPISPYRIIDSFPLAVYKFGHARYCKTFRDHGADYGKCPSKKETYFGYKVHALITLEGIIQTEKAGRNCVFTAKWPTQLPPAEAGGLLRPKGHFWATESRLQAEACFFAT